MMVTFFFLFFSNLAQNKPLH
jgi:hypothetical protein